MPELRQFVRDYALMRRSARRCRDRGESAEAALLDRQARRVRETWACVRTAIRGEPMKRLRPRLAERICA